MEENKTTRVNRTVNYYSDRPDYDRHMEKHNCHCERPHYDHCPEKPEYDCYQERPHYDHCPEKPDYDHHPIKPNYDHYPSKPDYDHHPVKPHYDHYPAKPDYDHHPVKPNYDHYPAKPNYDHHPVGPNHDCHDEKPKHECCEDKLNCDFCSERPKPGCCCPDLNLKPNGCTKCCDPIKAKCPDIHCAVCTPILTDKIHAFACVNNSIPQTNTDVPFVIDNLPMGGFPANAQICIEKISVNRPCIGISTETLTTLPINICSLTENLAVRTSASCSTVDLDLATSYEGTISSNFLCHDKGTCATFTHPGITVNLFGNQYVVQGFIGCIPFTARTTVFTEPRNYENINLLGDICLPKVSDELTLRANFEFNFQVKQITPTQGTLNANTGTFTASILDILSINEKLYAISPEELIVYSAPDVF